MRGSGAAALALAAAAAASGCGGERRSSSDTARAAVSDFARAFGSGDGARACERLTPAAQAAIVKRVKVLAPASGCATAIKRLHDAAGSQVAGAFAAATVSDVRVKGDAASARLTAGGNSTPVALVKVGGAWRLTGVPGIQ